MTQSSVSTSGLVRVTVASGTRRVDLVLPGAVPVAELVPELARSVGLLDSSTVYGGYRVITSDGRRLSHESGLTLQGVEDGSVVMVTAGIDEPVPPVYDDVVEAMTDVVEQELKPWDPASGRRTALAAAVLLLGLGAVSLLLLDTDIAATAAAVLAAVMTAGAIVLSRAQREAEAAVTVAWTGVGFGVLAGLMLAPADGPFYGYPVAAAGGAALAVALACLVGLGEGRALLVPAGVVGAVHLATGLLVREADFSASVVLVVVLTVVVLAGSVFPWLALGMTSTQVDQLYAPEDITADPKQVDASRVSLDARTAHEVLVAISATVGLLLVLTAPLAVSRGFYGTLLAVMASLVVMLRTRQYRTGSGVLVGLVSGVLGLLVTAASVLVLHADWRPAVAVVLAVAGALLLVATLLPTGPSVRRGRFGDVVETISLVSLLPLLVLASGLFDSIPTPG